VVLCWEEKAGLGWFFFFSPAIIITFCKTESEDDAKWQHKILQHKENSDFLYLSLTSGESDFLFSFPGETWGCRTLCIFRENFLLLFNCVYPTRFPLLQPGSQQRKTSHTQRHHRCGGFHWPCGKCNSGQRQKIVCSLKTRAVDRRKGSFLVSEE